MPFLGLRVIRVALLEKQRRQKDEFRLVKNDSQDAKPADAKAK